MLVLHAPYHALILSLLPDEATIFLHHVTGKTAPHNTIAKEAHIYQLCGEPENEPYARTSFKLPVIEKVLLNV